MRRRTVKNLVTVLGAVVIVAMIVGINTFVRMQNVWNDFEQRRVAFETTTRGDGHEVLDWTLLESTRGSLHGGLRYKPELKALDGQQVNLIGFMAAIDHVRAATYFILLPLPASSYLEQAPPLRDAVLVRMAPGKNSDVVEKAVCVQGTLRLNDGGKGQVYYTIENATTTLDGQTLPKATPGKPGQTATATKPPGNLAADRLAHHAPIQPAEDSAAKP